MNELIEKKVIDYINDVDSSLPAPGGGSVAALVGALGVALGRMAGHLSVEKKKFKEASKSKQDKFILAFKELTYYKGLLENGVDDDAVSYDAVIAAFRSKDESQIQSALLTSAMTAFEMQEASNKALTFIEKMIELANKNLYSDIMSGAILLASCNEMASFNVKANATLLKDEKIKNTYLESSQRLVKESRQRKNIIFNKINKQ